ncbi:MAG: polysaccharide biosynthesis C-terminal domain-containing protein [Acidimicrobiales bacterium]|nr:polysaccharide biosynthesis C-terminal domain-containing protein [Acidimicrobiales bacterium]
MSQEPNDLKNVGGGLAANYVAMAVAGASGLILNIVVASAEGADGLGLFSQLYVAFVIAAQPATAGLHYATLRWVAISKPEASHAITGQALRAVIPIASAVTITFAFVAPVLATLANSDGLETALRLAAAGLVFHAVNKVLMAHANGRQHMTTFAVMQALRVVFLVAAVAAILLFAEDPARLGLAFPLAEGALTLVLGATTVRARGVDQTRNGVPAIKTLLAFGLRSLGGGLVQELNARVDVVVLSVLVSDTEVGIYTLAATAIEGAFQLLIVLRNNINPALANALSTGDLPTVEELAHRYRRRILVVTIALWLAVALAFRPLVGAVGLSSDFEAAWGPLLILATGLGAVSLLLPFDQIFLLGGHPTLQTMVVFGVVVANIGLNVILVPWIGVEGAALSTAAAFLLTGAAIWVFARRTFGIRLL